MVLPLYAQLKERLIRLIQSGELAPGDQLPSQKELCRQYSISHMTVRRALNELINEGVIQSIHGKGLYVAERKVPTQASSLVGFYEHVLRLGKVPSSRVLDARIVSASTIVAQKLGVEAGVPVVYIRRVRLVDRQPMSIATNYLPHRLCPGLLDHDLTNHSLYGTLREVYGLSLVACTATISAVLADEEQSQLLNITRPAALVTEEQITYLDSGLAVDFSRSVTCGDRFYFQVQETRAASSIAPNLIDQRQKKTEPESRT